MCFNESYNLLKNVSIVDGCRVFREIVHEKIELYITVGLDVVSVCVSVLMLISFRWLKS